MSTVVLTYEGKKKAVKVSPSSVLQLLLKEICEEFSIDSTICNLKYRNTLIDKSLPFRLLNLPNNASLEIIVNGNVNALGDKVSLTSDTAKLVSKLAVSLENNPSITLTIPSNSKLIDVVERYLTDANIVLDAIDQSRLEVSVLGMGYSGDRLRTLTLYDLGLAK